MRDFRFQGNRQQTFLSQTGHARHDAVRTVAADHMRGGIHLAVRCRDPDVRRAVGFNRLDGDSVTHFTPGRRGPLGQGIVEHAALHHPKAHRRLGRVRVQRRDQFFPKFQVCRRCVTVASTKAAGISFGRSLFTVSGTPPPQVL